MVGVSIKTFSGCRVGNPVRVGNQKEEKKDDGKTNYKQK